MRNVDVDARLVETLLDASEDAERVAGVPETSLLFGQRSGGAWPVRSRRRRRRVGRVERSVAERSLCETDREPLRGERALRRDLQRLVKELGRPGKLGRPVLLRLLGRVLVLAGIDIVERARGAEGVHVVPRQFLERRPGKLARELELARLDEEVRVQGAQFGILRLRGQSLLDEVVRLVPLVAAARLDPEEGEASLGCARVKRVSVSSAARRWDFAPGHAPSTNSLCWLSNTS